MPGDARTCAGEERAALDRDAADAPGWGGVEQREDEQGEVQVHPNAGHQLEVGRRAAGCSNQGDF